LQIEAVHFIRGIFFSKNKTLVCTQRLTELFASLINIIQHLKEKSEQLNKENSESEKTLLSSLKRAREEGDNYNNSNNNSNRVKKNEMDALTTQPPTKRFKTTKTETGSVHVEWSGMTEPLPTPIHSFGDLPLPSWLLDAVNQTLQWTTPTSIQAHILPIAFAYPHAHFLVRAPTGSGKTACYLLPILYHLHRTATFTPPQQPQPQQQQQQHGFPRALILVPTPELAYQALRVCTLLTSHDNKSVAPQCALLPSDPSTPITSDILLTTPRLAAHRFRLKQFSLDRYLFSSHHITRHNILYLMSLNTHTLSLNTN
jgi:hypothetical protein